MTPAALFAEHHKHIYHYMLQLTHDPWLADDLTAAVWLKVMEAAHKGMEILSPTSWLWKVARNVWIDYLRCRKPYGVELDALRPEDCDEVEYLHYHDTPRVDTPADTLWRAVGLSMLSDSQVTTLRMECDGYSIAEMAQLCGGTVGGVKALRHRALVKMRGNAVWAAEYAYD